uniref:Uncharacterized protein n=1 Tax=Tanacetum cinerariifolium TaxID=118510 RepID=A0A6L2P2F0_TANCI|nr:hypothetical protein [Tanacetum cinerariifolium]
MVARKPTTKEDRQKKTASKADKPTPVKKPEPAKQTKPVIEKSTKPTPSKKASKGKVMKVRKGKRFDRLIDEEPQPTPEILVDDDEYNLQRGIQMSLESFQEPIGEESISEPASGVTRSLTIVEDAETRADMEKSDSEGDIEILNVDEEQDEDQAGSNPRQGHVALAGPNPEPMHEDFIAKVYPKVHESLKHTTEEHVFLENPPSLSRTLSSMKNLNDYFTFGDQFIDDKPTEEELASVRDLFREFSEFEMKVILRDRMFKSGSYRSQHEHTALYNAFEASIDRENKEEFIEASAKSRKRRSDDQDPPPPPPKDSYEIKKKRHNSNASASK